MGSPNGKVPVHGFTQVRVKLSAKWLAGQFAGMTQRQVFLFPYKAIGVRLQAVLHFLLSWKSANLFPVQAVLQ